MKKYKSTLYIFVFFAFILMLNYFIINFSISKFKDHSTTIIFDQDNTPTIKAEINGIECTLLIDLGGNFQLSLNQEILKKLKTSFYGKTGYFDFKGNHYESNSYLLDEIQIAGYSFIEVIAEEYLDEFKKNAVLQTSEGDPESNSIISSGAIGRQILKRNNLMLDFKKNQMRFIFNSDVNLSNFHMIPFEITPEGIVIRMEIDQGSLGFMLDTGSSVSIIRSDELRVLEDFKDEDNIPCILSSKSIIHGKDFGEIVLRKLNITD